MKTKLLSLLCFGIALSACGRAPLTWNSLSPSTSNKKQFLNSFKFNGLSSNVFVTGLAQTLPVIYTIELFFQTPGTGSNQFMIHFTSPLAADVHMNGAGTVGFIINANCGGGSTGVTSTNVFNDNKKHYLVGVSDGTNVSLYIDGTLQATAAMAPMPCPYASIILGSTNASTMFYDGVLEEVRISNVARTKYTPDSYPFDTDGYTINLFHLDTLTGAENYLSGGGTWSPNNVTVVPTIAM